MKRDTETEQKLRDIAAQIKVLSDEGKKLILGRRALVTSKFNGQQYGSSRKALTGETLHLNAVFFDECGPRVTFCTNDPRVNAGFALDYDVQLVISGGGDD